MTREINAAALDLIARSEGFVDHWYPDPAHGWKVPTCCFGHTDAAGEPKYAATKAKKFTRAEGLAILRHDVSKYAKAVEDAVKVPLNDNQFGALVSFCYNVGPGNFRSSSVLERVNAKRFEDVPIRLLLWNKAGGKTLKGLTRRRTEEGALFKLGSASTAPKPLTPSQVDNVFREKKKSIEPAKGASFWAQLITAILRYFSKG